MRLFVVALGIVTCGACSTAPVQHDTGDTGDITETGEDLDGANHDADPSDPDASESPDRDAETDAGTDAGTDATDLDAPDRDAPDPDAGDDSCPVGGPTGGTRLVTTLGSAIGTLEDGVRVWRGLPYAAPPTNERRFAPPAPPPCWELDRDASAFGPECVQRNALGEIVGQEDCLTLNVWIPEGEAPRGGWPLLFFIHGGGNVQGSTSVGVPANNPIQAIYDGKWLATEGPAVVVTANYRLGPFGFLALDELRDAAGSVGNVGIHDQIAAMQWVRANAEALDVDVNFTVVFGESAGALDTCVWMTSPLTRGLFSRAVMQSGGCVAEPAAAADARDRERLALTDCSDGDGLVGCLRGLSVAEIMDAFWRPIAIGSGELGSRGAGFGPVVDGVVLLDAPLAVIDDGGAADVPLVIGTNADEMQSLLQIEVADEAEYIDHITTTLALLGDDAVAAVLAAYPVGDYPSAQDALVQVYTDASFTCPARDILERAERAGRRSPLFRYFFSQNLVTPRQTLLAEHAFELFYVFGSIEEFPGLRVPSDDVALSQAMRAAWLSLALSGDPGTDEVDWPEWTSATDAHVVWDTPIVTAQGVRSDKCDVWAGLFGP